MMNYHLKQHLTKKLHVKSRWHAVQKARAMGMLSRRRAVTSSRSINYLFSDCFCESGCKVNLCILEWLRGLTLESFLFCRGAERCSLTHNIDLKNQASFAIRDKMKGAGRGVNKKGGKDPMTLGGASSYRITVQGIVPENWRVALIRKYAVACSSGSHRQCRLVDLEGETV